MGKSTKALALMGTMLALSGIHSGIHDERNVNKGKHHRADKKTKARRKASRRRHK